MVRQASVAGIDGAGALSKDELETALAKHAEV